VLQPAGNLGLPEESAAALGILTESVLNLLERHLAIKPFVACDRDLAESALGMRAEEAERDLKVQEPPTRPMPAAHVGGRMLRS
jgi:hypothetical protein